MLRYELKCWWTLKEFLDYVDNATNNPWSMANTFHSEFYTNFSGAPIWKDSSTANDYIEDLWKLVFARYYNDYILYTEDEDTNPDSTQILEFFNRVVNVIVLTYPKYSVLLKAYTDKQSTLLSQIASTSTGVARFNDTPQNKEVDDEFENDEHVTNITKTIGTNLTDGATPIQRLKEIQEAYKSVMSDWAHEFQKLFIDGENISL